jgi:hypothetical protein
VSAADEEGRVEPAGEARVGRGVVARLAPPAQLDFGSGKGRGRHAGIHGRGRECEFGLGGDGIGESSLNPLLVGRVGPLKLASTCYRKPQLCLPDCACGLLSSFLVSLK